MKKSMRDILGIDPGFRDPTAVTGIKYDYDEDVYYILDEYVKAENLTSAHAKVIRQMHKKFSAYFVFVDSAAAQFIADLAYDYDVSCQKSNKARKEGLGYVATLIAQGRVKVWHECTETIAMFNNYKWDDRPGLIEEKPKHDQHSHIADAVRYAIYSHNR